MISSRSFCGIAALFSCIYVTTLVSSCKTQDVSSHYTSNYIKSNKGSLNAEVPEAFELGYTILALTDLAQKDSTLIDKSTPYYKEVMARFGKFKDHRAVKVLDQTLSKHPEMFKNFRNGLYAFKMHDGRFVVKENYRIDVNRFGFTRFEHLFQDFYSDTHFDKFFAEHASQYAGMVAKANSFINYDAAQKMFNDHKNYKLILSPLMKGQIGTMQISSGQYTELVIFPYMHSKGLAYTDPSQMIAKASE